MKWYRLNDDNTIDLISNNRYPLDADFGERPKHVGDDTVNNQRVSTVFLSMDHGWSENDDHTPVLFETMIFGGEYDGDMWRYCTYDEAKKGHDRIVNCLKEGINPNV